MPQEYETVMQRASTLGLEASSKFEDPADWLNDLAPGLGDHADTLPDPPGFMAGVAVGLVLADDQTGD